MEPLEGAFLPNYLVPGLLLLAVSGATSLLGGILSFLRYRYAGEIGVVLGLLLAAWIVIQVAMIGLVHWLKPLYFGLGFIEVYLGLLVRRRNVTA